MFLCSRCADERARLYAGAGVDLKHVLVGVSAGRADADSATYTCRHCGTTHARVISDGKPGCCLCYIRFPEEMEPLIRKAQNHTRHVGKAPAI